MSNPDHVENTGDNLRHAAEVQEQEDGTTTQEREGQSVGKPLPDFNT